MAVRDHFEQDDQIPGGIGGGEGTGFLIGPYATYRIGERLYADGYLAYGRSDNELTAVAGSREAFDTNRFLTQFSLTGDYSFGEGVLLRPTLAYRRLQETQEAYTSSLGVRVGEQEIGIGELSFAPRLQTSWPLSRKTSLTPFIEAGGIASFGDGADILGLDSRARFEFGSSLTKGDNLSGSFSVFHDGLGADKFETTGLRFQMNYSFD
jgi:outer membrane autotransporter protein